MPITPSDITKSDARDNDGGLKIYAYYAPFEDILTFPAIDPAATSLDGIVTVEDDFVMKTGKKFCKIESTVETSGLDSDGVGEADGKSAENILTLQAPGSNKKFLGWYEEYKNKNLVIIVEEAGGGFRIVGSPGLPARIDTFKSTGGKATKDPKNITVTVKSVGRVAPNYTGTIPLTPAS